MKNHSSVTSWFMYPLRIVPICPKQADEKDDKGKVSNMSLSQPRKSMVPDRRASRMLLVFYNLYALELWKVFKILKCTLHAYYQKWAYMWNLCCRSIFLTDQSDETEILQPFSRTDILYNRNVTTLASAFEKDCAPKAGI